MAREGAHFNNILHFAEIGWRWETISIMAKNKINWRAKGIEYLQSAYGKSYQDASKQWENIYRKSLRQVRKKGLFDNSFNVSRETYASTVYHSEGLFDITIAGQGTGSVVEFSRFDKELGVERSYIKERFDKMAQKYDEVRDILNSYLEGDTDYETFLDEIDEFRNTNREYQKAGS